MTLIVLGARRLASGGRQLGARATDNNAAGIEVSSGAQDTVVTGANASGHLVDFCDEGTNTTESGGVFGTTSAVCIPTDPEQAPSWPPGLVPAGERNGPPISAKMPGRGTMRSTGPPGAGPLPARSDEDQRAAPNR